MPEGTSGVREREWDVEYAPCIYILRHRGNADYVEAICASKLVLDLFSGGSVYTCSTPV